jgi:hypothetical protein
VEFRAMFVLSALTESFITILAMRGGGSCSMSVTGMGMSTTPPPNRMTLKMPVLFPSGPSFSNVVIPIGSSSLSSWWKVANSVTGKTSQSVGKSAMASFCVEKNRNECVYWEVSNNDNVGRQRAWQRVS